MRIVKIVILIGMIVGLKVAGADQVLLIPQPSEIKKLNSSFKMTEKTVIYYNTKTIAQNARFLKEMLDRPTGYKLVLKQGAGEGISLMLNPKLPAKFGKEGYKLTVSKNSVVISARTPTGITWGCQTLRQLLPPEIFSEKKGNKKDWRVPGVKIVDIPRFAWRGMMLDSSRSFQSVKQIKKYIDALAMHKINVFHWHLTDDQGWRIEIKAYPKLTEIGSVRGGNNPLKQAQWNIGWLEKGEVSKGFYSQDEIRDIVKYAAVRGVQILPEIDIPGHSRAAVVAYPKIACKGKNDTVSVQGEKGNVWCASRKENYVMMEQILKEVTELFPFEYIHIGGDEVNHNAWKNCPNCSKFAKKLKLRDGGQLQPYLTQELEKICKKLNRKLVGWNEIMGKGISKDTCIMSWIGTGPGYAAAAKGHPVVMTPGPFTYFDMPQGPGERGHFWAGIVTTEKCYSFDPLFNPALTPEQLANIQGVQACLWTEFATERPDILKKMNITENEAIRKSTKSVPAPRGFTEHQIFPRLCALAEVGWTPQKERVLNDFMKRLGYNLRRLNQLKIHYRIPTPSATVKKGVVTIKSPYQGADVRYTLDGSLPNKHSTAYSTPFKCTDLSKLVMVTIAPNSSRVSLSVKGAKLAPVGSWSDKQISTKEKHIDFDLTGSIKRSGNWWVELLYTAGSSKLNISSVSLLENGKIISTDSHNAIISAAAKNAKGLSNYRIPLKHFKKDAKYAIRATVKGVGGTDSNGIVKLSLSDYMAPNAEAKCSINVYSQHTPSLAVDWNKNTFFWSSRPAKKGETFTWIFKKLLPPAEIEVKTGKPNTTHDILIDGKLQISEDGINFKDFALFSYGAASGKTETSIKAMRILVTANQDNKWIAVQDPLIKPPTLRPDVSVTTNMPSYGKYKSELTVDWKSDTYFWMGRTPKKGDEMTWTFKEPVKVSAIIIKTGDPKKPGRDFLRQGVVQISYDGAKFANIAEFQNGSAYINPKKAVKAVRLKVTTDQVKSWLIIQDIQLQAE